MALAHARFAVADSLSVVGMRRHAGHVLHALDPSLVSGVGPGLGYGVVEAAREAARHVERAAAADSISENVAVHTSRIGVALANAVRWSEDAAALAQEIQTVSAVSGAAPLASRLLMLCHAVRYGADANGDGIVGWEEGEGGLAQATYHMNLLRRGEGLLP